MTEISVVCEDIPGVTASGWHMGWKHGIRQHGLDMKLRPGSLSRHPWHGMDALFRGVLLLFFVLQK